MVHARETGGLIGQKAERRVNIIDRRLNPKGKSLANRQRFLRRAKKQILDAVREAAARDNITGPGDNRIRIKSDALREPRFHQSGQGGERWHVTPGNKEYVEGDRIPRPPQGEGGGRGGSPDGESEDAFHFVLSRDEFVDLFLEDLELPDLLRKELRETEGVTPRRAGFQTSGAAANLNIVRTMRNSLLRRIALRRPRPEEIAAREEELARLRREDAVDPETLAALAAEIEHQRSRSHRIPFIDPIDVRYNRFDDVPRPAASAVMFCLMDVSGSMTAHMKDLAKRFYKLLYLFLSRRYKRVEIVFIRHTHVAREVDEETFFSSTESGGTVVSTALEEMARVLRARYPQEQWNIYAAQASDGDNMPADNPHAVSLLEKIILPACQYFAYLEVGPEDERYGGSTELWRAYQRIAQTGLPIAMRKVNHRSQIYPVFRQLFSRDKMVRSEGAV